MTDEVQNEIVDEYRRIVVGMLKGHERTAHNAPIQSLIYEDFVKYALRRCLPQTLKIVKGEAREGINGSGDCDIIIYQGDPIYLSKSGLIGIVPSAAVCALVEVEDKAGDVSTKYRKGIYRRFRRFCPNVRVVSFTGYPSEGYYEKTYGVSVFTLANNDLRPHPGEFKRLVDSISRLTKT